MIHMLLWLESLSLAALLASFLIGVLILIECYERNYGNTLRLVILGCVLALVPRPHLVQDMIEIEVIKLETSGIAVPDHIKDKYLKDKDISNATVVP